MIEWNVVSLLCRIKFLVVDDAAADSERSGDIVRSTLSHRWFLDLAIGHHKDAVDTVL